LKVKRFECDFCTSTFSKYSAKGGHVAKAHPGSSPEFNHKLKIREERRLDRQLHQAAISVLKQELFGTSASNVPRKAVFARKTIKEAKERLVQTNEQFASIKAKYVN
jgi:hypothetical protein